MIMSNYIYIYIMLYSHNREILHSSVTIALTNIQKQLRLDHDCRSSGGEHTLGIWTRSLTANPSTQVHPGRLRLNRGS